MFCDICNSDTCHWPFSFRRRYFYDMFVFPEQDHLSSRFAGWESLPFLQKQQIDARGSTFNDIGRDQHNHFYIFADQDPSTNADHQKMDVGDVAANKGTGESFVLY